jgi:hypothetical protein
MVADVRTRSKIRPKEGAGDCRAALPQKRGGGGPRGGNQRQHAPAVDEGTEFQTELREARRTVFTQAIGRLQDAAGAAATTVLKIMLDPNAPAATRLRASEIVLDQAAKAGEMEDIENRVAKLELTAGLARKSRKSSAELTWLSATPLPFPVTTPAQIAAPIDNADTDKDVVE